MHLTVGYLATPTGDDGVALASALAKTFGATVDVVLVVREELPDGHPGRAEYQQLLISKGQEWIAQATSALADGRRHRRPPTCLVGESFSESLIAFAEEKDSDLIVIGGARDGIFGGHVIGSVAGALLHCSPIPVALAPRGYAEDPRHAITSLTAAVPTRRRRRQPLAVHAHVGQCRRAADPHGVAGVRGEPRRRGQQARAPPDADRGRGGEPRGRRPRAARRAGHRVAGRRRLTLESALKKLNWDDVRRPGGRVQPVRGAASGSSSARRPRASWQAPTRP